MKALISACAADNGKSGIGQYTLATLEGLTKQAEGQLRLTVYVDHGETFLDHLQERGVELIHLPRCFSGALGSLCWHFLMLPLLTLIKGADFVLFLAANRRLAWIPWATTVAVVHDLSQLHIKGKYDVFRTFYVLRMLTFLMRRIDRLVSVSESTRRDLMSFCRIPGKHVAVVHNGANLSVFREKADAECLEGYGINRPYLIYTARLESPGKNHIALLNAFRKLQNFRELQLVFAGAPWNGAEAIYAEIERLGLQDQVIVTGFVPSEHLPALVQSAELFVFPSLFEGFGIPLLEAMAAGTPVCAANRSSLPEVAGDAAALFDPEDIEDMAQVVQNTLQTVSQPDARRQWIRRGEERAAGFTWERSVSNLLIECRRTVLLAQIRNMTRQLST